MKFNIFTLKSCSVDKFCIIIFLTTLTSCELDISPFGDPTPCNEKNEPLANIYGWVTDACTGDGVPSVELRISANCKVSPCSKLTTWQVVSSATTDSTGYFIFIDDKRRRICPNSNFFVQVSVQDGYKTYHTGLAESFIKWSAGDQSFQIYPTGILILDLESDSTKSMANIEFINVGTRLKMGNVSFSEWLHVQQPCQDLNCISCNSPHCLFIDSWKNVMHYVHISYVRDGIQNYFNSSEFFIGCEDTTYKSIIF